MKKIALSLMLTLVAAAFVARPAAAQSGRINLGPLRIVVNGGGARIQPRPGFNPPPIPQPLPIPSPLPLPRPNPQPAPAANIPPALQGSWVERFGTGDVWYHELSANGQHIVTTVTASGQSSSVVSKATFSQGNLTIGNGSFRVSPPSNGRLTLSQTGKPERVWTRGDSPAPAPSPAPSNMVDLIGTWYERQQNADGSPVLFRYDLNQDGSYDMFKYAKNGSGDWDLDNPTAHLGARTSADARPWSFDGQKLTLADGQPYAEGPMQYSSFNGGIRWTNSKGVRTWTKNP